MAPQPRPKRQGVFLRLPVDLLDRVHELAADQQVSVNSLLAMLVAGSVGWDLTDDLKFNRRRAHGSS